LVTGYVGGIRRRNDPCFPAGLDSKLLSLTKILFGFVTAEFSIYRGRISFATMFFLSFESEIPVAWQRGSELPPSGRAKQEQFGAMQGNKIARRMTRCPAINSNHEVIREGTSSSSRLP